MSIHTLQQPKKSTGPTHEPIAASAITFDPATMERNAAILHADVIRRSLRLNSSLTSFSTQEAAVEQLQDWNNRLTRFGHTLPDPAWFLEPKQYDDDLWCVTIRNADKTLAIV